VLQYAPPSLHRKAAADNMLQIIEAHPNWPVYADVFEHPSLRLASRRPIWSDMTSVDTDAEFHLLYCLHDILYNFVTSAC